MGNEASTMVRRFGRNHRGRHAKEKAFEICGAKSDVSSVVPLYKKKAHRLSSSSRFTSVCSQSSEKKKAKAQQEKKPPSSPLILTTLRTTSSSPNMKDYRRSSVTQTPSQLGTPPVNGSLSSSNLLVPQGKDRRRSRSLCQSTMQNDLQEVAAKAAEKESSRSRKNSSAGLVPQLNRLRIQQSYKSAKPIIGEMIMKRAAASRSDFRAFLSNLDEEQGAALAEQTYLLISDAVENLERSEKALANATRFGESFVSLCPLGFRPDLFSVLADACIAECVRLDGGAHKRCETLLAWSQLFAAIFSPVRDGYYQRIRYQRRASLPQYAATRQQSTENSNPNSRTSSSRGSQEKDD